MLTDVKEDDMWDMVNQFHFDTRRVERVKKVLMEYLEPKPKYSGMSAHEMATLILKQLV